jgi:hypothetical protein
VHGCGLTNFSARWHSSTISEEDDAHGCGLTNFSARRHPSTISEEDDAHGCGLVMISRFIVPFLCTMALIFHLRRRQCARVRPCYNFEVCPSISLHNGTHSPSQKKMMHTGAILLRFPALYLLFLPSETCRPTHFATLLIVAVVLSFTTYHA